MRLVKYLADRMDEEGSVGAEYGLLITVLAAAVATGAAVLGPKIVTALSNGL
ncbi:MAG: Flp pilus assembly pilin Flp [Candidatus Poriferisodalaceae bacterium]|jgi:Flp pilus assembly pilin Flp